MTSIHRKSAFLLAAIGVAMTLVAGSAFADKPGWAEGKSKEGRNHHEENGDKGRDDDRYAGSMTFSFGGNDRRIVSEFYGAQVRKGRCPPGLAKKKNGCQPPGQAKKWQKGQPLAKDVEYNELPKELRARLPAPPPNHRYIQIAGDILMIAAGTGMVVDAIEDILR